MAPPNPFFHMVGRFSTTYAERYRTGDKRRGDASASPFQDRRGSAVSWKRMSMQLGGAFKSLKALGDHRKPKTRFPIKNTLAIALAATFTTASLTYANSVTIKTDPTRLTRSWSGKRLWPDHQKTKKVSLRTTIRM